MTRQVAIDDDVYEVVRAAAATEGRLLKAVVGRAIKAAYPEPQGSSETDGAGDE